MSRFKMFSVLCAPLRSATIRALALQARGFLFRFLWLPSVVARKLLKVKNCHRHTGLRPKSKYQPVCRCYLPSPWQCNILLSSKSVHFTACPSARRFFPRVYRALVFSAAHSVRPQATRKRGSAHHIRLVCGHRGTGVAFCATIKQERPDVRHRVIFCGTSCASIKYKSRKRVRVRALSRFASQRAHVHASNPDCMPAAYFFFQSFKRLKSTSSVQLASRASKFSATLRTLDALSV